MEYSARVYTDIWKDYESFCTTEQFGQIGDKTYLRHCGPVAITNLILTLQRSAAAQRNAGPDAESHFMPSGSEKRTQDRPGHSSVSAEDEKTVFQDVAAIGQRMGIYRNMNLFGHFGGTSDLLIRPYLRKCFEKYGISARIERPALLTEENVRNAVLEEKILYVELHHHPRYHNHHLICYSAEELLLKKDLRQVAFYLKCADGWTGQPVYLSADQMPFGSRFYGISTAVRA